MEKTINIQISQRGVITLPKSLRQAYDLKPGDTVTLVDMDGIILISPRRSQVDRLADEIGQALVQQGETLESMLTVLREQRERYDPKT